MCVIITVFFFLIISVSLGSTGNPFLSSIDHELPTTSSTLATIP